MSTNFIFPMIPINLSASPSQPDQSLPILLSDTNLHNLPSNDNPRQSRPYPTRPTFPDPIIARIISHYFHLRRTEREGRQKEATRKWEYVMRHAGKGGMCGMGGGMLELRDEREASEGYRVLPLLLVSHYTSSLTLPFIYSDLTIVGMRQLHRFISRPAASSYAHIKTLRFEQSFVGQRSEGYFLGEERLAREVRGLEERLREEREKRDAEGRRQGRGAWPMGAKVIVGKTSLAVFNLVAVLQIPEIVFLEDAAVPVSPLWIAYNSFMGERARLRLPELKLTIEPVDAEEEEAEKEVKDDVSVLDLGGSYSEEIKKYPYHSDGNEDSGSGSDSSHSTHSHSRSYSTSSTLSDISLTQPLLALIAQLKHNESMSIRLEPVKQLHSRKCEDGEDLLRGIEVMKVVCGDGLQHSEVEQDIEFGYVQRLPYAA